VGHAAVTAWLRLLRPARPRAWCPSWGLDSSSTAAFDRHRVGLHAYLFAEGLAFDPPREDGRRCLDVDEIRALGMLIDGRGRWALVPSKKQLAGLARIAAGRASVAQDAPGAVEGTPGRVAA
jgi:hypothetical protein